MPSFRGKLCFLAYLLTLLSARKKVPHGVAMKVFLLPVVVSLVALAMLRIFERYAALSRMDVSVALRDLISAKSELPPHIAEYTRSTVSVYTRVTSRRRGIAFIISCDDSPVPRQISLILSTARELFSIQSDLQAFQPKSFHPPLLPDFETGTRPAWHSTAMWSHKIYFKSYMNPGKWMWREYGVSRNRGASSYTL